MKEKILIADDNQYLTEILKTNFELLNYQVITAENGEEALNRAKEHVPDLIVLDIMMPKLNGYQVCRKLKSDSALRNIIVVMLTAKSAPSDKYWGMDCGADVYVTKPFETEELEEIIKKKLAERRKGVKQHPVTGLPTVDLLQEEKIKRNKQKKEFVILTFHFKDGCFETLESVHGKFWASDVLVAAANCLKEIAKTTEKHEPFICFSGDNTFILLLEADKEGSLEIAKISLARLHNALSKFSSTRGSAADAASEKTLPSLVMGCKFEKFSPSK